MSSRKVTIGQKTMGGQWDGVFVTRFSATFHLKIGLKP